MQWVRSLVFTGLLFLTTAVFGVIVLVAACLPLSLEQRYAIPRTWGRLLTWLAGDRLRAPVHDRRPGKPAARPFISLWKHSSAWETMAQMFVVPPASWLLKREVIWIPIVGWAVSTYKPIAINRKAGHSAVNQVVAQGRDRLAAGMGVIVYPEGTRVAPGQTRKYGVSGALLACADRHPDRADRAQLRVFLAPSQPAQEAGHDSCRDRAADRPRRAHAARSQRTRAAVDRGQDRGDRRGAGRSAALRVAGLRT